VEALVWRARDEGAFGPHGSLEKQGLGAHW
jgi:hypothetical protein